MSKFEKLTPAFQSDAIEKHREIAMGGIAIGREQAESEQITEAQLKELVRQVSEVTAEHPQLALALTPRDTPAYHKDEDGTSLHVGLKASANRHSNWENCITIMGQFEGTDSSNIFDIYRITSRGELFRANPDGFEPDEEGYWKKVSLTAQKDTRRVEETRQMLASITKNGEEKIDKLKFRQEDELQSKRTKLEKIVEREMADDIEAFREFHTCLQEAMHLKQVRQVRTPAQALEFKEERERITKQLEGYGVDFSLTSQIEGMLEATDQTLATRAKILYEIQDHKVELENTKADHEKAIALRDLNIG